MSLFKQKYFHIRLAALTVRIFSFIYQMSNKSIYYLTQQIFNTNKVTTTDFNLQ